MKLTVLLTPNLAKGLERYGFHPKPALVGAPVRDGTLILEVDVAGLMNLTLCLYEILCTEDFTSFVKGDNGQIIDLSEVGHLADDYLSGPCT
jgi:hypothetical protein